MSEAVKSALPKAKPKKRVPRPLPQPGDPWTEEEERRLQSLIRHDIAAESLVAVVDDVKPVKEQIARVLARWHLKLVHPAWGEAKLAQFDSAWKHPNVLLCADDIVAVVEGVLGGPIYIESARRRLARSPFPKNLR